MISWISATYKNMELSEPNDS